MKPYGYKKIRKPPGDGCHLCMKGLSTASKTSKSANRRKAKEEIKNERTDDGLQSNEGRGKKGVR